MASLRAGTLTLLFTDIEGSTRLLRELGPADYGQLLTEHHRILRAAISGADGAEVKTEGDAFFAVFPSALDAVRAAIEAQRALAAQGWPRGVQVRVRMGLHTGDVEDRDGEYVGLDVHRGARISSAAHGGQVLLSATTSSILANNLPQGISLRDLGAHNLKDLDEPVHLFQLVAKELAHDFPPPRSRDARYELLPTEASTFIGRQATLARAHQLLAETRLLTLTGPGGTGKTRLAIRLAREAAADYDDGAAFVGLAAISDPGLVPTAIRVRLGIAEQPGRATLETLEEELGPREMLVVLDNFEQVAAAGEVVARLLRDVPGLRLIITSRVALHLEGEQEFAVPPLAVPAHETVSDLAALSSNEAVALLVQRARSVRPDFALTQDNATATAAICHRLDGLPLAIELAASRIKLLPPPALLERLGRSLDLLQSNAADRSDRQRTLRGAIEWSYRLLTEPEQTLFRRLAIFAGGFEFEDAEKVALAAGSLGVDVFDGIATLVDNSLIRPLDGELTARFDMLETIRQFGRAELETAGELDATARTHALCVLDLVTRAEPHLTSDQVWLNRLEGDHDNIRAALQWLSVNDVETALWMAGRLWRFWHLRGHLREGAALLRHLLDDPRASGPTPARAKALIGLAGLAYWQLDYPLARPLYEEALEIARGQGDRQLEVEALYSLAFIRVIERDLDRAADDYAQARRLYEELGDGVMALWAVQAQGLVATMRGDHARAVELLELGVTGFEQLGDAFGLHNSLSVGSRALMHLNRLAQSREWNGRAIQITAAQGDETSLSAAVLDAAALAELGGDHISAARLIGAAERMIDEAGGQPPPELMNRIEARPALERELEAGNLAELIAEGRSLSREEVIRLALS